MKVRVIVLNDIYLVLRDEFQEFPNIETVEEFEQSDNFSSEAHYCFENHDGAWSMHFTIEESSKVRTFYKEVEAHEEGPHTKEQLDKALKQQAPF